MKLVTCGLPYANGKAHIGHLRTYVPADVYVRYLRMAGEDVVFVCGSDCHGTPIVVNAEQQGLSPRELIDIYHNHFIKIFDALDIKFDYYGRTDAEYHHRRTAEIVSRLIDKGYIYPKEIMLAYCPKCKRFLPDRYVEGICPHCGAVARGDECDQGCGRHLEPGEIKEPRCKICGSKAEFRSQKHYFFKLTEFRDFLEDYLSSLKGTENALNYARNWVKNLRDWCITRNLEWGVRFPKEEGLVVYVWVDAPIGYISFTEKACEKKDCDWRKIWIDGEGEIIHFIGLDIVYHHCIFWPAMLKGADYTLPSAIVASGMVKVEGKTFSKSRGYVVWVEEDYLKSNLSPDYLRYYIVNYTSHQKDLNFSWDVFREKVNNEIIATLGNFLYRVLLFAWKNFGEVNMEGVDEEVIEKIKETEKKILTALEEWEFKIASDAFMELATYGNVYFQSAKPWELIKTDREAARKAVASCLQLAKALIIFAYPVMPRSMEKMARAMSLDIEHCRLSDAYSVDSVMKLDKPEVPFTKIEDDVIERLQKIMEKRFMGEKEKEEKEEVTIEDFQKLDIRIGKVLKAEKIKKSKKLIKLIVDIGDEQRQIVSGIAEDYKPEELEGKLVVVLANLRPAKFMGVESKGMILAAEKDGRAILLTPEKDVDPGTRVC
ncbi:methionine--tRNA ligase [Archaeoglobus neptunius]|uniref:methionine--tRNA ligase n=1 Tax=Archaeoglobus neptunius TaxID=2798580 RepID=UPI0019253548|nr:methionine--tRNA ligase [Archaeoglobus neptunius]